ncbi:hypothetical protein [Sinomonas sp. RB5]
MDLSDGKMLRSAVDGVELRPWAPATALPQSEIVDGMVRLPALCRKHSLYYPPTLLREALRGQFYAFVAMCACSVAYLIEMESDGAHCKAADDALAVAEIYENLRGEEFLIREQRGDFVCKRLPVGAADNP